MLATGWSSGDVGRETLLIKYRLTYFVCWLCVDRCICMAHIWFPHVQHSWVRWIGVFLPQLTRLDEEISGSTIQRSYEPASNARFHISQPHQKANTGPTRSVWWRTNTETNGNGPKWGRGLAAIHRNNSRGSEATWSDLITQRDDLLWLALFVAPSQIFNQVLVPVFLQTSAINISQPCADSPMSINMSPATPVPDSEMFRLSQSPLFPYYEPSLEGVRKDLEDIISEMDVLKGRVERTHALYVTYRRGTEEEFLSKQIFYDYIRRLQKTLFSLLGYVRTVLLKLVKKLMMNTLEPPPHRLFNTSMYPQTLKDWSSWVLVNGVPSRGYCVMNGEFVGSYLSVWVYLGNPFFIAFWLVDCRGVSKVGLCVSIIAKFGFFLDAWGIENVWLLCMSIDIFFSSYFGAWGCINEDISS